MSKTAEEWLQEGIQFSSSNKPDDAIRCWDEAIKLDPDCAEAYFRKGFVNADDAKLPEEVELYQKAISLGYQTAQLYYCLGIGLKKIGKIEEAAEAYSEAITRNDNYWQAYENRAQIYFETGRIPPAIEDYKKAIEFNAGKLELYGMLGIIYEGEGDKEEALRLYDLVLDRDSSNFKGNRFKAELLISENKFQEALPYLDKIYSAACPHPGVTYSLGYVYMQLGDSDKATSYWNQVDQMKPENTVDHCNRGRCYMAVGRKQEALEDFKKTQELLNTAKGVEGIAPLFCKFMKATIKTILEIEEIAAKAEAIIEKAGAENHAVKEFLDGFKQLQEQKSSAQAKLVNHLATKPTEEGDKDLTELGKIKEEMNKGCNALEANLLPN